MMKYYEVVLNFLLGFATYGIKCSDLEACVFLLIIKTDVKEKYYSLLSFDVQSCGYHRKINHPFQILSYSLILKLLSP